MRLKNKSADFFKALMLILVFGFGMLNAQTHFIKPKSFTVNQLIDSVSNHAEYCHPHIQYKSPDKKTDFNFYFVLTSNFSSHSINKPEMAIDHSYIVVYSISSEDGLNYQWQIVDSLYDHLAGDFVPKIETVFFANCDTVKDKELFISFSNPFIRLETNGVYYHTWAYHFPNTKNAKWIKDDYFSNIFTEGSGTERNLDDETKNGVKWPTKQLLKYNSAQKIKAALKQMGY